jgi:hypothetical protein
MHEEIQMKMTRYSEPQILAILRQAEGGVPVAELCREHGMSTASFGNTPPDLDDWTRLRSLHWSQDRR